MLCLLKSRDTNYHCYMYDSESIRLYQLYPLQKITALSSFIVFSHISCHLFFCSSVTGSHGSSYPPAIYPAETASCGTAPSPGETPWPSDFQPFNVVPYRKLQTCIYNQQRRKDCGYTDQQPFAVSVSALIKVEKHRSVSAS